MENTNQLHSLFKKIYFLGHFATSAILGTDLVIYFYLLKFEISFTVAGSTKCIVLVGTAV